MIQELKPFKLVVLTLACSVALGAATDLLPGKTSGNIGPSRDTLGMNTVESERATAPRAPGSAARNARAVARAGSAADSIKRLHTQIGIASFYAARYFGRTMADGTPMRPYANNAASLTLPLGSLARVTNLQTGRSAVVAIRDRGPYVKGRIIDLSPATARNIGMSEVQGLAKVRVMPIPASRTEGVKG